MRVLVAFKAVVAVTTAAVTPAVAPAALADSEHATHYYVSLGDSYADSAQPKGDFAHGYAEQLYLLLSRAIRS